METSTDTIVRVGTMLEFRKSRRSLNRVALARLAQKLFSTHPSDIIFLGSESALERTETERARGKSLIAG